MSDRLVFKTEEVLRFVQNIMPLSEVEGMQAIGLARDEVLIAGVIYEGFNGFNIWMHVAATPGKRWLTRSYLAAAFGYAFTQCKANRISAYVDASNVQARRFDEHLGFRQEAVLRGAAQDGGDVVIYAMRREECRYVG